MNIVQVDNVKKKCNENLCGLMTEIRALEVVTRVCLSNLFKVALLLSK